MSTFVLKKEYELQLPSSYVDIDRKEIEYIDGGYRFDLSRDAVAFGADVGIALVSFGVSSYKTIKSFLANKGKVSGTQLIVKIATKAGIAKEIASKFAGVITTVLNFSIGYGIAYLADRFDKTGLNGRVQF